MYEDLRSPDIEDAAGYTSFTKDQCDLWAAQGFIEATSGNVVDYGAIEERIRQDSAVFDVREIAYDPWNGTHTSHCASRTRGDG